MNIIEVSNDLEKQNITRYILEALPEWFGLPESREEYILDSIGKIFFCAYTDEKPIGFLYLKETGKDTVELAVMGVLKEYHRNGIGKTLFESAKKVVSERKYSFISSFVNTRFLLVKLKVARMPYLQKSSERRLSERIPSS